MRFKSTRTDRLSPEEREIVDRFERGVIDAGEAGRLLIASVDAARERSASVAEDEAETADTAPLDETTEEAKARALVERIARDVYDDPD
jgi:hypothetical protein